MTVFLVIALIAFIVWILKSDGENANIANQNLASTNHNLQLYIIAEAILIKRLGAEKTALLMLNEIENSPSSYSILKKLYENAGLDYDNVDKNEKNRKIVLRTYETGLKNLKDQLEDEFDN